MTGIYKILSPTNKVYIGQSINISERWRLHKRCPDNSKLYNSLKKHGVNNHVFTVIHELPDDVTKEVLDNYEQLYLDAYRDCGIELLNTRDGGSFGKLSDEVKNKISEGLIGHIPTEATREKWRQLRKGMNIGRKLSQETKDKISAANKGNKMRLGLKNSPEHRAKISAANKGKTYRSGFKLSDEHKSKITGRPKSKYV